MQQLKFGKKRALNKAALLFSDILSSTVPDHPPEVDHLSPLSGWQMLGNDRWGDCVAVTWADIRRLATWLAGHEYYANLDQVIEVYKTQNKGFPDQDEGMYIQLLLEELHRNGGPDGARPIAFARVDPRNDAEVEAAISIFGFVWIGFGVQSKHMSIDFPRGLPFDYHPGDRWVGGHSVVVAGYDSDNIGPDKDFKTWAKLTAFTEEGWRQCVDEVWVVIWEENLGTRQFQEGIDRQKLADAYRAVTGDELPLPPEPEPAVDVDAELAEALERYIAYRRNKGGRTAAGQVVEKGQAWLDASS